MSDRVYNFSAGPAVLPESVLQRARDVLWTVGDTGAGILEISHRSPAFTDIIDRAEALCRQLADIPERYRVLFLQGGASSQFYMVPMNLLSAGNTADYIDTGIWSQKAIKEARRFGRVHVAGTSEDENYSYIPDAVELDYSDDPRCVHFTSNNTIFGTEFATEPETPAGVPLVCDASSDMFSRPIDVSRHGIIYAGAQKNLGPSGVTLVIIDDALVEAGSADLPTMLQYRTHAAKGSRFNTPPTFAIYVVSEVLAWIAEFGGLTAMAEYNRTKAAVIYDFLDESALFHGTARADSRSLMNICFKCAKPELEPEFITKARTAGLSGLAGHRSVGGMRASVYNAFPRAGCDALVAFMKDFEREHG